MIDQEQHRVIQPDVTLADAFLRLLDDYEAHDPANGEFYQAARLDFPIYVQSLHNEELGVDLESGKVPCSHRWIVREDSTIVAIVRVRHNINTEFLAVEIGHIGYDVPPSHRGQGYGIAALNAGLQEAQKLGIDRVLVCADTSNPASWRTIERCGGVLETERFSSVYQCLVRRYWITVI